MKQRIGVVGIVLKGDKNVAVEMQKVLSEFADIIIGRMGVPREEANAIARGRHARAYIRIDGKTWKI